MYSGHEFFFDTYTANIFTQSVVYLFIFLTMLFDGRKFLIWMRFDLSIFYFMFKRLSVSNKQSLLPQGYETLSPICHSKSIYNLSSYKHLIYIKLIWVCSVRKRPRFNFFFLVCLSILGQIPLVEKIFFLPIKLCCHLCQYQLTIYLDLISGFPILLQ